MENKNWENNHELWDICLKEIELDISKANFNTWFKNTAILKEEDGIIYIAVPNEFVKEWLGKKFHKNILKALVNNFNKTKSIEYIVTRIVDIPQKEVIKKENTLEKTINQNKDSILPFNDLYINRNDNLNSRYTFNNFIVGPFNELAHAAAQAIIQRPGTTYNPFFIYGPTGLGKTHLLQALGNEIKKKHPETEVFYTNLEKFSTDYIQSVQTGGNKTHLFKEKYRKYDLLIMDDIQFIGKMEKTQEELFHLFNSLYENNKQIVFSSDKHPNLIIGLEERLLSRFSQGMIVDISEPDFESRIAIIKEKVKESNIEINQELINFIAENIKGNIRELEGVIKHITLQYQIKKQKVTISDIKNLFKTNIKKKKGMSPKEVVKIVSNFYNIDENLIYEKTRRKEIVQARQMIMFILREDFNISYPNIGQELGGKDHTTIIHSYKKIKREIKENAEILQEYEELKNMFK
jgi:chromosomal replication initiator protein